MRVRKHISNAFHLFLVLELLHVRLLSFSNNQMVYSVMQLGRSMIYYMLCAGYCVCEMGRSCLRAYDIPLAVGIFVFNAIINTQQTLARFPSSTYVLICCLLLFFSYTEFNKYAAEQMCGVLACTKQIAIIC